MEIVDRFSREEVYELFHWVCQWCFHQLDPNESGPMMPTIDHIIPRVRGGKHALDNVRPVHKRCNSEMYQHEQKEN